ncbi:MAG: GNAT family N-acetyltransferase [Phycisphaerales bacterium]|nr:GNAT family N-acetyltransferase [Phycisphaerales bacterium]
MPVTIQGPRLNQASTCEPILRALPDWFGIEDAIVHYVREIESLPTFIAEADNQPVGFLSVKRAFDCAADIYVMGILREHHRNGVGRALLEHAEAWLAAEGVRFLQVKTLSPSHPSKDYARTRAFYQAVGFHPLEEFPTLWGEASPCLQMIKALPPSS